MKYLNEYKIVKIGFGDKLHIAELYEKDGEIHHSLACGCSTSVSSFAGNRQTVFDIDKINSPLVEKKLCKVSKIVAGNLGLIDENDADTIDQREVCRQEHMGYLLND